MRTWRRGLRLLLLVVASVSTAAQTNNETASNRKGPNEVLVDVNVWAPSNSPSRSPATLELSPGTTPKPTTLAPTDTPRTLISSEAPTTLQPSDMPSSVPSVLPSSLPSYIPSGVPSSSLNPSAAPSLSTSPTISPSKSPMPSATPSAGPTESPQPSPSPSSMPSVIPSSSPSLVPTLEPTSTPTTPTLGPTGGPSFAPSVAPTTAVPSLSHSPTGGPTSSFEPTGGPTSLPSASPSASPTNTIRPTSVPSASPTNSLSPSIPPSSIPTSFSSSSPTMSRAPSELPSSTPSISPTSIPSLEPSAAPSMKPSVSPSLEPSAVPSEKPSESPSVHPSERPSLSPSLTPTLIPSAPPSDAPSASPSSPPSDAPSVPPSNRPSLNPSASPTYTPSASPSRFPSMAPSVPPTNEPTTSPSYEPSAAPSIPPTNSPTVSPTTTTERGALTIVTFRASQTMDDVTKAVFESTTLTFIRSNLELNEDYLVTVAGVEVTDQTLESSDDGRRLGLSSVNRRLQTSLLKIDMKISGDVWQRRPESTPVTFQEVVTKPLEEDYSEYLEALSDASSFFEREVEPVRSSALEPPIAKASSGMGRPALIGMIVGLSVVALGVLGLAVWRIRRHSGNYNVDDVWRVRGSLNSDDSFSVSTEEGVIRPEYTTSEEIISPEYRPTYGSKANQESPSDSSIYMKSNRSLGVSNQDFQAPDRNLPVPKNDTRSSVDKEPEGTTYAEIMKATEKYAQMLSDGRSEASNSTVGANDGDRYIAMHTEEFRHSLAPIGENDAGGNDDFVQMQPFCALSMDSPKKTPKQAKMEDCEVGTPKGGFVTKQSTPKGTQFVQLDTKSATRTGSILDDLTDLESEWDGKLDSKVNSVAETPKVNNLEKFHRPPKQTIYYQQGRAGEQSSDPNGGAYRITVTSKAPDP